MRRPSGTEPGGAGSPSAPPPAFATALMVWGRIGLLSFGGPAAQIALMHRMIVEERGWLGERQFLNALSFCMLLPGPEAMQLATWAGWRLHGWPGGLAAGLLFVLPGAATVLALAAIYAAWGTVPLVEALFLGIKAAVLIIVVEALARLSRRALQGPAHWLIAAGAFAGLFLLALPFPLIIAAAGLYGFARGGATAAPADEPAAAGGGWHGTAGTVLLWLAIWWLPLLALAFGAAPAILFEIGLFFSKLAVVTFGGAYAVLAYMAQAAVEQFGWLDAGEMLDGLGLAETTPGPLILVTEFVGFIAAWREGGFWLGAAGAAVTLWATFAPCFLWIFAGAPYIEGIGARPRLRGALAAITAAVVGVILNLSVWFALHVFFAEVTRERHGPVALWRPDFASLDWRAALLAGLAAVLLLRLRWGLFRVLLLAALAGLGLARI